MSLANSLQNPLYSVYGNCYPTDCIPFYPPFHIPPLATITPSLTAILFLDLSTISGQLPNTALAE